MAFNDLPVNKNVSLLDASTSAFNLKSGQAHVTVLPGADLCLSKQDAFVKYNLVDTVNTNGIAINQLMQKSFWEAITTITCNQTASSGGVGVTEIILPLDKPLGGIVVIDFGPIGVPDKLEIIHNGVKKATSGMTIANEGPFDNVYGSPTVPLVGDANVTNQFIGTDKGAVPTRYSTFTAETGITDIVMANQQLVWWVYTQANYDLLSSVVIRVTGISGTAWDIKRLCTDQTPSAPVVTDTTPPLTPGNPAYTSRPTYTADDDDIIFTLASDSASVDSYQLQITKDGVIIGVENYNVGETSRIFFNATTATLIFTYNFFGRTYGTGNFGFRVRAKDAAGNVSAYTPEVFYALNSQTQGAHPTYLSATNILNTSFTLNWVGATVPSTYRIFKDNVLFKSVGEVSTTEITGLTAGTTSNWKMQSESVQNPGLYSPFSDILVVSMSASVADITPPTTPSITTVTQSAQQLHVNFTASTDNVGVDGYEIWRQEGGGTFYFHDYIPGSTSPYVDYSVTGGISYGYKIRAYDAAGNFSTFSNILSKTLLQ